MKYINEKRSDLIEGRQSGLSFALGTHNKALMPISACKDYINDILIIENNYKKPFRAYGFYYEKEETFDFDNISLLFQYLNNKDLNLLKTLKLINQNENFEKVITYVNKLLNLNIKIIDIKYNDEFNVLELYLTNTKQITTDIVLNSFVTHVIRTYLDVLIYNNTTIFSYSIKSYCSFLFSYYSKDYKKDHDKFVLLIKSSPMPHSWGFCYFNNFVKRVEENIIKYENQNFEDILNYVENKLVNRATI